MDDKSGSQNPTDLGFDAWVSGAGGKQCVSGRGLGELREEKRPERGRMVLVEGL
jgi:hypothetical protein